MSAAPDSLQVAAARAALFVSGVIALRSGDGFPASHGTLALLSPDEPAFWPLFRGSPEARDGHPDPIDRWSRRIGGALAGTLGGIAAFPFGGPPYAPFFDWALRSGRAWSSPVGLLVHDTSGLFVSFRGAVALPGPAPDAPDVTCPCATCVTQPCRTACPVGAFAATSYDTARCHTFLDTPPGTDCMDTGCAVRRACPVGAGRRLPAQSAQHMRSFHP